MYSLQGKKVWVAGHSGMVGSAVVRRLRRENIGELITVSHDSLDLTDQRATLDWVSRTRPEAVFVCAAKVGGIIANSQYPANFIYENIMIEANIINACHLFKSEKLLFLGSSCIYPRDAMQPIDETALLDGKLEKTNEAYAVAKIAGLKLCEAYREQYGDVFISAMPANLYGPGDNYNLKTSHVIPGLIRKAHLAKIHGAPSLEVWGTGKPRREFLHADDCAAALVHLMKFYDGTQHVNVGSGEDISIGALAQIIMEVVGFDGELVYNDSIPDGTPRKLMNTDRIRDLGWRPSISLRDGLTNAYEWFLQHQHQISSQPVAN